MITTIAGLPIEVEPFCPPGKMFIISGESAGVIMNIGDWETHFWDDVWGTGLRPIRWEYLPNASG